MTSTIEQAARVIEGFCVEAVVGGERREIVTLTSIAATVLAQALADAGLLVGEVKTATTTDDQTPQ